MATKNQQRLRMIEWYMKESGKTEVDMRDVAAFAIRKGYTAPAPESAIDRLAKIFAKTPAKRSGTTRLLANLTALIITSRFHRETYNFIYGLILRRPLDHRCT